MGLKVTGHGAVGVRLNKIAERSTRALRRVQEQGAAKIAEIAAEMAPYKTGELEMSIKVTRESDVGTRVAHVVEATADHAVYMHEGHYDLGPGSVAKQGSTQHEVGRKYMERAVDHVMDELDYLGRAAAAVRSASK